MMEPNSKESVEVFCAETAISILNVASKFAENKLLYSNPFFCQGDPFPDIFKTLLVFNPDPVGLLVSLIPVTRHASVKRWNFTIVDNNGNTVLSHDGDPATTSEWPVEHFLSKDFSVSLAPAADVVWICTAKIYYEGSPSGAVHMSGDLLKLLESAECADITFTFGGEEIKAHKAILITRSKYYSGMFQSKLMEDTSSKIEVTDADPKVFRGMLEFLYSGLPPKQLNDIALDLFVTADKYGIEELRDICELNLRARLSVDNVVDALLLAEQHNLQDLMAAAKVIFRAKNYQRNFFRNLSE